MLFSESAGSTIMSCTKNLEINQFQLSALEFDPRPPTLSLFFAPLNETVRTRGIYAPTVERGNFGSWGDFGQGSKKHLPSS